MKTPLLLAGALALAAASVDAQQPPSPGRDAFKGKVKPGLYEIKTETDMSGMPGMETQKVHVETGQKCVTQAEVDKGIEPAKNCKDTAFKATASGVAVTSVCTNGATNEMKITFTSTGYRSEMKSSGKMAGKDSHMVHRSTAKYLGACKS